MIILTPLVSANRAGGIPPSPTRHSGGACPGRTLLGIPSWDRGICLDETESLSSVFEGKTSLILATNVITILVSIAGLVAVAFVIVGGFLYVLSSGNAEKAKSARQTIIHALVGLVIAVMARVLVEVIWRNLTSEDDSPLGAVHLFIAGF